jgi:chromosome segregation ATPase
MFEADTRTKSAAERRSLCNPAKMSPGNPIPGTVFYELKLSQQLANELEQVRGQLTVHTKRLKEVEQAKESAKSDLARLQLEHTKLQASFKLISHQLTLQRREIQANSLVHDMENDQFAMYKHLYETCEADKKSLISMLHEEKSKCDKLKNRATELEQSSSLLHMENDIIGERLKGLYRAIADLAERESLEGKVRAEVQILADMMNDFAEEKDKIANELTETIQERDQLRLEYEEMTRLRGDMKSDKDRILTVTRDKIMVLTNELTGVREELEKSKTSEARLEKRYKDLEDEHTKLRQKVKQNRLKRKQFGEADFQICRWCQREYSESENFNWSCRTHRGEFGDHMYWCCGKTAKDAPGCQVRKHESKEEEEDMAQGEREEIEQLRIASTECPVGLI